MKLALVVNKEFRAAVEKLAKQPLPLRTAYKLKTMMKRINEEHAKFEELRNEAVNLYGEKDADGVLVVQSNGSVNLDGPSMAAFSKELAELANMDVEIGTVKLSELGNDIQLTTEEIFYLDAMIEDA